MFEHVLANWKGIGHSNFSFVPVQRGHRLLLTNDRPNGVFACFILIKMRSGCSCYWVYRFSRDRRSCRSGPLGRVGDGREH